MIAYYSTSALATACASSGNAFANGATFPPASASCCTCCICCICSCCCACACLSASNSDCGFNIF
uniref:Uncharacterized protein n=1 Tax=uncultured marine virus TaxID=186617 RepID=A0A0F7L1A2_9VIRU|nr:hypothetical protein ALOHA_HF400048F7ctg1g11 [uncultured marine virus]